MITVVLGGAKAPPSNVEGTRPPGARLPGAMRARVPHDEVLGRQLVHSIKTTQKAWACRVSACACLAVVASVWTLRVVVITGTVHVVVHQCVAPEVYPPTPISASYAESGFFDGKNLDFWGLGQNRFYGGF